MLKNSLKQLESRTFFVTKDTVLLQVSIVPKVRKDNLFYFFSVMRKNESKLKKKQSDFRKRKRKNEGKKKKRKNAKKKNYAKKRQKKRPDWPRSKRKKMLKIRQRSKVGFGLLRLDGA